RRDSRRPRSSRGRAGAAGPRSGGSGRRSRAWSSPPVQQLGGPPHGTHDVLVAGAPAEIAGEASADRRVVGVGRIAEQFYCTEKNARRAEAALEPVRLPERLLHGMERLP